MNAKNWRLKMHVHNALFASALGLAIHSTAALAQDKPAATAELDTVVVTGSYIRGTPEDSALPVDVISSADLAEQGSPTIVQLVKTITASQASIGESNRYNGAAGTASINLRGFGAARTLTLFNGRRLADNPHAAVQGGGANLNFIPQAAIGRVEILKDGAAATYGSDAIGGVINFISRTDLDGLETDAEYSKISGSNGDYQGSLTWGKRFDGGGNVLISFGYRHRSRLDIHERDWALAPFESALYGGWTGSGNPGFYVANNTNLAATNLFRDNGCTELGGYLDGTTCRFQFSTFNDIVNDENHYQAHIEFNGHLSDSIKSHTEMTWGRDFVPHQRVSPANLTAQYPTPQYLGGSSGSLQGSVSAIGSARGINNSVRYNVPWYNPGLQDLIATCGTNPVTFFGTSNCGTLVAAGTYPGAASLGQGGVDISPTVFRAIAHAGHPTNPDKADHESIETKSLRISSGLQGEAFGANWDAAVTFMSSRGITNRHDLLVNRIQNGLNGYLSLPGAADQCTSSDQAALSAMGANRTAAAHAALGCYFFNPFTNSVAVSAVNGQSNPFYRGAANPSVINNPQVIETLYGDYTNEFTNNLLVFDGVFSGTTGISLWSTDTIGWAVGTQYRFTQDKSEYGDLFNNEVTRCVDSIDDNTPDCATPNGPLIFYGSNNNSDSTRNVYALFAELSIPIAESLNASLAARYESYPGNIGSTFDPKLSLRWQAVDWLAFRGSIGTTFRAPTAGSVTPGCSTGVSNINGSYRAVATCGNTDLVPETATAYNFGILFNPGSFTATIDYFKFTFEDELTVESASRLFATMFPTATGNCGSSAYAALEARFVFAGACNSANVVRINTYNVNGPGTDTSGIDFRLQYDWPQVLGGSFSAGLEATYLLEYQRGAFALNGAPNVIFSAPEDRNGTHDLVSQFFSYPKAKGNVYFTYHIQDFTFRLQSRYSKGTTAAFGTPDYGTSKATIDDYWQHDLIARWSAPFDMSIGLSVQNVLDTDPPDAPSQFNYDYTSGNPLGRVFEISVHKKF